MSVNPARERAPRRATSIAGALALVLCASGARAEISAAPDIDVDLSGVVVADDEVAIDDQMGGIAIESFGGLPVGVEVDAYHAIAGGDVLFSTDVTAVLGAVTVRPEDVVRFDGVDYSLEFDGSGEGVPAGVDVDAVTIGPGGDLVLSFDTDVVLGGTTYADEDLVRFDGASFAFALDASAAGFDAALDLDAAAYQGGAVYAVSFDGHGAHGGVAFADEDVLSYDPSGPTTTMVFEASAQHAGWHPADLGALPEPDVRVGLLAAGFLLAALRRTRRAR